MGKDLQALRGIAQILAVTIVAELNNISGKDRSCNGRLSGRIELSPCNVRAMRALACSRQQSHPPTASQPEGDEVNNVSVCH